MIIGVKRKEEVIKMRRYGMYENYVPFIMPVMHISLYKNAVGV